MPNSTFEINYSTLHVFCQHIFLKIFKIIWSQNIGGIISRFELRKLLSGKRYYFFINSFDHYSCISLASRTPGVWQMICRRSWESGLSRFRTNMARLPLSLLPTSMRWMLTWVVWPVQYVLHVTHCRVDLVKALSTWLPAITRPGSRTTLMVVLQRKSGNTSVWARMVLPAAGKAVINREWTPC